MKQHRMHLFQDYNHLHSHRDMHKCLLSKSLPSSLLKRTVQPPCLFQFPWRMSGLLQTFRVWVLEMICSICPLNPLPNMKSLYVGQWIVISILNQLWANVRMFGYLWKKSRVNIVFFLALIRQPNCLVLWLVSPFILKLLCLSPSLLHWIQSLNVPKVSVWITSNKTEQVGMTDMSSARQHATWRCIQHSPLPGGYSLLGCRAAMFLSKVMSQEYIIVCYP